MVFWKYGHEHLPAEMLDSYEPPEVVTVYVPGWLLNSFKRDDSISLAFSVFFRQAARTSWGRFSKYGGTVEFIGLRYCSDCLIFSSKYSLSCSGKTTDSRIFTKECTDLSCRNNRYLRRELLKPSVKLLVSMLAWKHCRYTCDHNWKRV